jgi:hypothetical protein
MGTTVSYRGDYVGRENRGYPCIRTNADLQILILIFAEVLGLYGLIVALILNTNAATSYKVSYFHHVSHEYRDERADNVVPRTKVNTPSLISLTSSLSILDTPPIHLLFRLFCNQPIWSV